MFSELGANIKGMCQITRHSACLHLIHIRPCPCQWPSRRGEFGVRNQQHHYRHSVSNQSMDITEQANGCIQMVNEDTHDHLLTKTYSWSVRRWTPLRGNWICFELRPLESRLTTTKLRSFPYPVRPLAESWSVFNHQQGSNPNSEQQSVDWVLTIDCMYLTVIRTKLWQVVGVWWSKKKCLSVHNKYPAKWNAFTLVVVPYHLNTTLHTALP